MTAIASAAHRKATTLMAFMLRLLVAIAINHAVAIAINSYAA